MAELTKEQRAAAKQEAESEGLVAMSKDGCELLVHPTCVDAHKEAGWTVEE